ncbi:MAG TPA: NPCBM/NEW2 domain-containing protein [Candidatus Hydrogenedentes bacterium]|nr:NPCBM/NEW2 domain-containing protein [Candidatus Hydrogenedentota bacterium]HPG69688.1 NPCBM/NEW2 domain-containing protein [Candidatus Hydrogenedentota bacterium]
MDRIDIPAQAPNDIVMATPAEIASVEDWAALVFAGQKREAAAPPVTLELRRQDHSTLHFRQSCMDTPIVIGNQTFAHGLGTHANSEIAIGVPEGATRFEAFVGIDTNYDTQGKHGSVEFSVEIDGREVVRTPTLRGGNAAYPIAFELPNGARQMLLKVDTTADGPSHDQSDWADARFVLADGQACWLDEGHANPFLSDAQPPFSFRYGDQASADFLAGWTHTAESEEQDAFRTYTAHWRDAATGLDVAAEAKVYKAYPAVDWVLYFENTGAADTPIIEGIQALDLELHAGAPKRPVIVGHNRGDVFGETSFENIDTALGVSETFFMAPQGGRSSNGAFPFFDVRFDANTLIAAVGWSGQWSVACVREGEHQTHLRAGLEQTHLVLHPGERIRTPRILLMANAAEPVTAHNRFRRLMLFHYVPQHDGRPVALPVVSQCFDRYSWTVPEWATEAGQIDAVEQAASLGFDSHWFDAAWFVGGFPNGVGNWYPKPEAFPRGLKPVADACHERSMKFVLWFEPERVAVGTQIATEYPDFVFGGEKGGLFRLDMPEARRWLTDLLATRIDEYDLDVYRNDFNIDPLGFWRGNDTEDRQGMTEIRYVEGLYAMWDELLEGRPGLVIDDCASGGRRIDLEMCMRSVPLWRSDTNCSPGNAEWNPGHSAGISYYLPLHAACAWAPTPYEVRAATTTGLICQWPYLDKDFPADLARRSLAEAKSLRKYWYGDLYPLSDVPIGAKQWCVFQLHRPDLGEGIALFFRRAASPYTAMRVALRAIDAQAQYTVERRTEDGTVETEQVAGGTLLDGIDVRLPECASSVIVRYTKSE